VKQATGVDIIGGKAIFIISNNDVIISIISIMEISSESFFLETSIFY